MLEILSKIRPLRKTSRLDYRYGPHSSRLEALEATIGTREKGLIVGIIEEEGVVDYWFKKGTSNTDLVPYLEGVGTEGKSAYQVWLDAGNIGTRQDFIDSIKGDSNYQIWLDLGYEGTEEEYQQWLRGEDGREIEISTNNNWIIWRYKGSQEWKYLKNMDDLRGLPGKEIELDNNGEYVRWRYEGETGWNNLYKVSELKGEKGDSIEFNWRGTELGIRKEGDEHYQYVQLKGEDGKSILQIWLEENPSKTEEDFWNHIKGRDGYTCRVYRVFVQDQIELKYRPCDDCDGQETIETILEPTKCDGEDILISGGHGYPIIKPIDFGTGEGEVSIKYDTIESPTRFILYKNGAIIFDTGYRGSPSYAYGGSLRLRFVSNLIGHRDPLTNAAYPISTQQEGIASDGYPEVRSNPVSPYGEGSDIIFKDLEDGTYELKVYSPIQGSNWEFSSECVGNESGEGGRITVYSLQEPEIVSGEGRVDCVGIASGKPGIPGRKGDKGDTGRDAFEVWRDNYGNPDSTEQDYLEWIKAGTGDKYFEYTISEPLKLKTIEHNLDKYCSVTVINSANQRVECQVEYVDKNTVIVSTNTTVNGGYVVFN